MTVPFNLPTQFNSQTIMDPGAGGAIASGIAQVLAAQQQARENQFRQQELARLQQQADALNAYYQGTIGVQNRQEDRLTGQAQAERTKAREIGGALRRSMAAGAPGGTNMGAIDYGPNANVGTGQALPHANTGQPVDPRQAALGNATQSGPGLVTQAFGASVPSAATDPAATAGIFEQILTGAADSLDPYMRAAIYEGVSPENLPDAVKAVQEVQPKPPELATSSREFEYYKRLQMRDPAAAAEYRRLFLDPKPTTQITNIAGQGESEFSKEWAKSQVKLLSQGIENAENATGMFPALNEAFNLVAPGKAFTGFGANQILGLARVASAIGAPLPPDWKPSKDRVADSQTLLKLLREQTLAYLRSRDLGSGTAVSDNDRLFMERQSGADLTLDPATIKRIIRINVGSQLMKAQEAVADLRDQVIAYPQNAAQLERQAIQIERKLAPIRVRYAKMLEDENATEQGLRDRVGSDPRLVLPGTPR